MITRLIILLLIFFGCTADSQDEVIRVTKNTSGVIENSNNFSEAEKPLKIRRSLPNRVDINILKSKLQGTESKESKKNLLILTVLFTILSILGISFSL